MGLEGGETEVWESMEEAELHPWSRNGSVVSCCFYASSLTSKTPLIIRTVSGESLIPTPSRSSVVSEMPGKGRVWNAAEKSPC